VPLLKVHGRASSALRGRIETLLSAAPAGVEELIAIVRQEAASNRTGGCAALRAGGAQGPAAPAGERDSRRSRATVDHVIERNF